MRTCGRADLRTCGRADLRTCGRADLRTCGPADFRTFGLSDFRTFGRADLRTCGLSDFRTFGRADVRTCGRALPQSLSSQSHRQLSPIQVTAVLRRPLRLVTVHPTVHHPSPNPCEVLPAAENDWSCAITLWKQRSERRPNCPAYTVRCRSTSYNVIAAATEILYEPTPVLAIGITP